MQEPKKNDRSFVDKLSYFMEVAGKALAQITRIAFGELSNLKKKVEHYIIMYGLFLFAIIMIAMGIIRHISFIFGYSEGLMMMILGGIIMVYLGGYSVLKRL